MNRMLKVCMVMTLVVVVLLPLGPVQAQNAAEDNACYAGGTLAGKCDTEWEWVCGWYLARWEAAGGWAKFGNSIVDWCSSILPPRAGSGSGTDPFAVNVICHNVDGLDKFCFDVNLTGYRDIGNDGTIDTDYITGDFAVCPPGYFPIGPFPTDGLANDATGFTLDELFNILGLGPWYCIG